MLITVSNMKLASVFFVVLGLCLASVIGDEQVSIKPSTGVVAPPVVDATGTNNLTSDSHTNVKSSSNDTVPKQEPEKASSTEKGSISHSSSTPSTSHTTPTPPTSTSASPITVIPVPDSKVGDWKVVNKATNLTCIRIKGELQVELTLRNNTQYNVSTFIVPPHVNVSGNCSVNSSQQIIFELDTVKQYYLKLSFSKNESSKDYYLEQIDALIPFEFKSKEIVVEEIHYNVKHAFITPINQSYICKDEVKVALSGKQLEHSKISNAEQNKTSVFKTVSIQLEAFKTSPGDSFDPAISCSAPEHTPDIVPIIVGCALAVLVIAVLVAYLVSRRRSQARGYLSM